MLKMPKIRSIDQELVAQQNKLLFVDFYEVAVRAIITGASVVPTIIAIYCLAWVIVEQAISFGAAITIVIFLPAALFVFCALAGSLPAALCFTIVKLVYDRTGKISFSINISLALVITYLSFLLVFRSHEVFKAVILLPLSFLPSVIGAAAGTRLLLKRAAELAAPDTTPPPEG